MRRKRNISKGTLTIRKVDKIESSSVLFDVKGKVKRKMHPRQVSEDVYAPVSPYQGAKRVLTFQIEDADACIDVVRFSVSLTHTQSLNTAISSRQDAYDSWCEMLKAVETGDMLTIRNAYVVNNEFVRKSKSTNEDEMLHPLQTNHPRRLVLYVVLLSCVVGERVSIECFHIFLGYAIDRHDAIDRQDDHNDTINTGTTERT